MAKSTSKSTTKKTTKLIKVTDKAPKKKTPVKLPKVETEKKPRKKPTPKATTETTTLAAPPSEVVSYFDSSDRKYSSAVVPDVFTKQTAEDPVPVVVDPIPVEPPVYESTTSSTTVYDDKKGGVSAWVIGVSIAIIVTLVLIYC
jgi:hypothetical protein